MKNRKHLKWRSSANFYISLIRTLLLIGLKNVLRVAIYRFRLRLPISVIRRSPPFSNVVGPFFLEAERELNEKELASFNISLRLFSRHDVIFSSVPDWFNNPINGNHFPGADRDWWRIPDFDPGVGDIKVIWELSRFDWVLKFARLHQEGSREALNFLDLWLSDWCKNNPPYKGPNWKCGQEASIRVLNLIVGAIVVGREKSPSANLMDLVRLHLLRIAPTISYAVAQDNNHGTSEAAALFVGGGWLCLHGDSEGRYWHELGRYWLEERAVRLIDDDGGFSQYSVNYHRLMLDTFSIVDLCIRKLSFVRLSDVWYKKAKQATFWLWQVVDEKSGDAPNIGANDGARLLQLTECDYRDFRPSVQLAMALFCNEAAYECDTIWSAIFPLLNIAAPNKIVGSKRNWIARNWGLAVVRKGPIAVFMRFPQFRFRPSHADALHLDVWISGRNLLRDAGTYSYNTDSNLISYFSGVDSHNTVQFDGRDQMPRLSRFLFGDWLKPSYVSDISEENGCFYFGAAYRDPEGASHSRKIRVDSALVVVDELLGFKDKAVLRWRLAPGDWRVDGHSVVCDGYKLTVNSSVEIKRFALVDGVESRFYLEKTSLPVLEVEIHEPGNMITELMYK